MKRSLIVLTIAGCLTLTLILLNFNAPKRTEANSVAKPTGLVIHEWGTFTSIAGKDGAAIDWRPLSGASDLPKFVYTDAARDGYRGTYHDPGKGSYGRVRMETPVIYFYAEKEMDVSVSVEFPQGKITEWYPQASVVNAHFAPDRKGRFGSGINWGTIRLLPEEKPIYLREISDSHYYPARETDAVPIQVCNHDKTKVEKEKFLFYRGIGDFDLPLKASLASPKTQEADHLLLENKKPNEIGNLIVFENFNGRISFKLIEKAAVEKILVEHPVENKRLEDVFADLEKILVAQGLYAKEAKAMIETWKDSWFEEGLRVFYVLPTAATNEILPLKIEPKPAEIVRVLVGRVEIITPQMQREVRKQVGLLRSKSTQIRQEAQKNLQKHGRFYEPILRSILESETDAKVRAQIQKLISQI